MGLHHPWNLSPKMIQRLFLSLSCGLQVVADDGDVVDRKKVQSMMMMLLKVLMMMLLLIERSKYC